MAYQEISQCRLTGDKNLIPVVNLGNQYLTGVFPRSPKQSVTCGPLELVWSPQSQLLQLHHSYDLDEMYGDNYGYRSGLNNSMVTHLSSKVKYLQELASLKPSDVVLDIGSNDGTTLNSYSSRDIIKVGIDPTASKFKQYYDRDIKVISTFFNAETFYNCSDKPAKIISSIAMFYDLESPITFARDVSSCLEQNGIWHFEQSYMPSMLRRVSYDTICHEHLEYYSVSNIEYILHKAGMKILDVSFNSVNGGSFAVTAAKKDSIYSPDSRLINWHLEQEKRLQLHTPAPYRRFEEQIYQHRCDLVDLLQLLKRSGSTIAGYGASTKGNVILQFCGIDCDLLDYIVDVNPLKDGCITPGSHIPIVNEDYMNDNLPDYFLVLPWHFRQNILQRERLLLDKGVKFIFPLPEIEII